MDLRITGTGNRGSLEYTAGGRSAVFPVLDIKISTSPARGITVVVSGPVKRKALIALAAASSVTVTMIAPDGTRAYSTVVTLPGFAYALSQNANHMTITQPYELH